MGGRIKTGSMGGLEWNQWADWNGICIKFILVSDILKKSELQHKLLGQVIHYRRSDLESWSPVTKHFVDKGMCVEGLSEAAIEMSDNTAANILLSLIGGPKGVTLFSRSIGDNKFRLDRKEPKLNSAVPGDLRDTTTPKAMRQNLQNILLGRVLHSKEKMLLSNWMKNNKTGDARIRAGVPRGWIVSDKTGTGNYGTTNDIAVIYPPHCSNSR